MASDLIAIHRLEYKGAKYKPGALIPGVDRRTARDWTSRRAARRATTEDRKRIAEAQAAAVEAKSAAADKALAKAQAAAEAKATEEPAEVVAINVDLSQSISKVLAAVEGYSAEQLHEVLAQESKGQDRVGVRKGIEKLLANIEAPAD